MTCAQKGHCWHEADGSVYARHSGRPVGMVDVHCCHCGTEASLQMNGQSGKGQLLDIEHGERA